MQFTLTIYNKLLDYELKISVWCNLDLLIVYEKEIFWI